MASKPQRRSAIDTHYVVGEFGRDAPDGPGVVLTELVPSALWQVNGAPPEAKLSKLLKAWKLVPPPQPNMASSGLDVTWVWTGPGQWMVVARALAPADLRARLDVALAGTGATLCDLGHARTVFGVAGSHAVEVMCKGCAADIESLQPGACLSTQLGHFSVNLVHRGEAGFEVYVFRSFGLAMWEWLSEASAEFGCRVEAVEPAGARSGDGSAVSPTA